MSGSDEPIDGLPRTMTQLERGIEGGLHLGGQLFVQLQGRTVADTALGESAPGRPMRRDDLMLWLSSVKPVGAIAIAQQWEAGRLELDDPVARHLPEFGNRGKEAITIRHLLTHTAGIRMLDVGWPRLAWEEIIDRICQMKTEPGWTPGHRAGYHRASTWFLLGELIRRIDGRSFDRYVRERIFEPLDMVDCWVGMPAERFRSERSRLVPLFDTARTPPRQLGWDDEAHVTRCHPGGNGYGPIRQLGRLYGCLLDRGRGPSTAILRPQTVEALAARHRVGLLDRTFREPLDWGLGLIPNSRRPGAEAVPYGYGPHASPRAFGHSGYRSSTAFADPEHQLVVAMAVNGAPDDARHLRRFERVLETVYEELDLGGATPRRTPG